MCSRTDSSSENEVAESSGVILKYFFAAYNMESLNNGHIGVCHFVHYREVVLS